MKFKKYQKKFDFSYSFGVIPTIELLKSNFEVIEVFISENINKEDRRYIELLCKTKKVNFSINDNLIKKVSFKDNTLVIAAFKKSTGNINIHSNHIILLNPTNPGNLGTIIRSMHAFNLFNLSIIQPAVDYFNPKAISASTGSFFHINIEYFSSLEDYLTLYDYDRKIYCLDSSSSNVFKVKNINREKFSLLFGNESTGIPKKYKDEFVHYKINHNNQVESLNLATSVSITLYDLYNNS